MPGSADLPFDDGHDTRRPALSVSELTAELRLLVEDAFSTVVVEGEISNFKVWSSGHLYFTLKDDRAQIRAVMFRMTARTLTFRPEDGMHVIARGRVTVYDVKGEYQVVCDSLAPHGLGARQAAFEALKRRLSAEGLFEAARKRPLPILPRRIGVVTSLDGAAVRDIVRVLTARYPGVRLLVRPARVQGEGASEDLVRALTAIGRIPDVDVIIIGRGGGSAEDLDAFNDERLARAIAASPVPVIAAIGHEVDFTIADFVADVRAATPSNAAELVVERADHFFSRIDRAAGRLQSAFTLALARRTQRVDRLSFRLNQYPARVAMRHRDVGDLQRRLERAVRSGGATRTDRFERLHRRLAARDLGTVVARLRTRLVGADAGLWNLVRARRLAATGRLSAAASRLDALSPLAVLARGYAVCWNEGRTSIIRRASAVVPGSTVHVRLAEGELACRVETTRSEPS
jgi:exodeoxyribonuclease VII large subunit